MPQAEQLSNIFVSTVTFLKEGNISIMWPHLIRERERESREDVPLGERILGKRLTKATNIDFNGSEFISEFVFMI